MIHERPDLFILLLGQVQQFLKMGVTYCQWKPFVDPKFVHIEEYCIVVEHAAKVGRGFDRGVCDVVLKWLTEPHPATMRYSSVVVHLIDVFFGAAGADIGYCPPCRV